MKKFLGSLLLSLLFISCLGQSNSEVERTVGGPCQGCEALLDYRSLGFSPSSIDTLPGFMENDPKIRISGTVFEKDGKTPAENILLYVYHTDRKGIYQPSANPKGYENRHGQYRGWLKTNKEGKFTFYTFRPAAYPNGREPEHIHIFIKEANTKPYYIDGYFFDDDPKLTAEIRASQKNRGGSGIIKLEMKEGIWTANRNIILGLNISDY